MEKVSPYTGSNNYLCTLPGTSEPPTIQIPKSKTGENDAKFGRNSNTTLYPTTISQLSLFVYCLVRPFGVDERSLYLRETYLYQLLPVTCINSGYTARTHTPEIKRPYTRTTYFSISIAYLIDQPLEVLSNFHTPSEEGDKITANLLAKSHFKAFITHFH